MSQVVGENAVSTLTGLYKDVFGENGVRDFQPTVSLLQEDFKYKQSKEIGKQYTEPVCLSQEQGFTYAAADAGAFSINTPVAAILDDAKVTGAQILLESRLSYEAAMRAKQDKASFERAMPLVVKNMHTAMRKRVELGLLYGGATKRSGIGVASAAGGGSSSEPVDSTHIAIVMDIARWAPAIWAGAIGMQCDFYDNANSTSVPTTLRTDSATVFAVTAVNIATRTITFVGDAGDIDDIGTSIATTEGGTIYPRGSFGADWLGLTSIVSNTGSMFDIDGAVYDMWQGNVFSCGSKQLTMQKIFDGLDGPIGRGLEDSIKLYVNSRGWTDVMNDIAALRKFDASYKKTVGENGVSKLVFHHQSGTVEIATHKYMHEGFAVACEPSKFERIGASDITDQMPGTGDTFFYNLPSNAGVGMRLYTFQCLFTNCPSTAVLFTDIVNS